MPRTEREREILVQCVGGGGGAIISCLPENGFKLLKKKKKKKKIQIWEQTADRENEERVHFCTAPEKRRGRRNQTLARERATK